MDAKTLCKSHYHRNARYGSPLGGRLGGKTLADRLWAKVDKSGDCWIWTGAKISTGYGSIGAGAPSKRTLLAHRVAYELANGPIPAGMVIDHKCHVPACVNPEHLRVVTQQKNVENRSGSTGITGVRGVFPIASNGKLQVRIGHNRKLHNIGCYSTLAEAEAAAIAARNMLHTHNDADRISA